jgi:hypothetical protein
MHQKMSKISGKCQLIFDERPEHSLLLNQGNTVMPRIMQK